MCIFEGFTATKKWSCVKRRLSTLHYFMTSIMVIYVDVRHQKDKMAVTKYIHVPVDEGCDVFFFMTMVIRYSLMMAVMGSTS